MVTLGSHRPSDELAGCAYPSKGHNHTDNDHPSQTHGKLRNIGCPQNVPLKSPRNISLGTPLRHSRVPGVPPQRLAGNRLMAWLRGRRMIVLAPFGILDPHVIDRTTLCGHGTVRVLLRDPAERTLGHSSFCQHLDDAVPLGIKRTAP